MKDCDSCHRPAWACAECLKDKTLPAPSHADRIRAMSDEELAKFMQKPFCDKRTDEECKISYCGVCDQCILDWLRQPAEGKEKPEHPLRQP